jgi:hypothetical protein
MDEQIDNQGASKNPNDPTSLLPRMPKMHLSRRGKIVVGVIALVLILSGVHFSLKPSNEPTETIAETPSGGLVTITPPADGTPAVVPEIVKDKDGKEYLTGELIVVFRASIPVDEAKKMVATAGGTVKQHFTEFPVFLVGINEKGAEGVNRAILRFQTMPEVERAEPNYLTGGVTP